MSKKEHYCYEDYRELAFLYVIYFLSKKSSAVQMDKTNVRKKMLEIFPEETNFDSLLSISELHGSMEQTANSLNITDLGIETATRLNDPIKTEIFHAISS